MKARKVISATVAGLCAVSTMSMSAFAAASTEDITAAGEKAYKITAAFQAPVLDVTVPTAMNAVLNPYKIVITTETGDTGTDGVTSPEYTIANNDTVFGITVAARATVTGLDAIVDSADKVNVTTGDQPKNAFVKLCATPVADGEGKGDYTTVDNSDLTKASELVFAEEMETAVKLMQITKAADADTPSKGFVKIAGDIPTEPTEKWTTADKLSLNVVFDINPYNPDGSTPSTPAASNLTYSGKGTFTGSGNAYTLTVSEGTDNPGTSALTFTPPTGKTIQSIAKANASDRAVNVSGTTVTFANCRSGDSDTLTITYDDSSTATVTITVTA